MFKKNTAVTGFAFHMVASADGSDITTGSPQVYYTLDGGSQTVLSTAASHVGNGQWKCNLTADEMNGDMVGLEMVHDDAISTHFTIITDTYIVSDVAGSSVGISASLQDVSGSTTGISGSVVEVLADTADLQGNQGAWATATGFSTHSAADVVDEWETQSQTDPTGFHVNVMEVGGVAQTYDMVDIAGSVIGVSASLQDVSGSTTGISASMILALADTNEIQGMLPSKSYLTGTANSDGDVEMDDATGNYPGSVASVSGAVGSVSASGISACSFDAGAIDSAAIADNAIDAGAIAACSITNSEIADGLIVSSTFAADAINAAAIGASAIAACTFAAGAVDSTAVADGTIDAGAIAASALSSTKFASNAIVQDVLAACAIGPNQVAGSVITTQTFAAGALNAAAIGASALTSVKFASDAIVADIIAACAIGPDQIAGSAITAATFAAGAINDVAIAASALADDINAEVLDVLNGDTFAEPGQGAPGATVTLAVKIGYLYKAFRNKIEQSASVLSLYNDNGTTVGQAATVSDNGSVYTRGELGTGA